LLVLASKGTGAENDMVVDQFLHDIASAVVSRHLAISESARPKS
jgi:hypothetical protein